MLARAGPSSATRAFSTTFALTKQQRRQKPFPERRGGFGLRRGDGPEASPARPERDPSGSESYPRGKNWRSAVDRLRDGENPVQKPRRGFGLREEAPLMPDLRHRPPLHERHDREIESVEPIKSVDPVEPVKQVEADQAEQVEPEIAPVTETAKSDKRKRREPPPSSALTPAWEPTKKLTFAAMAGLRELHAQDPETFTPSHLAKTFGVSREAVTRILRSKFRVDVPAPGPASLRAFAADPAPNNRPQGLNSTLPDANVRGDAALGKWAALARKDFTNDQVAEAAQRWDAGTSPVPAIRRAFEMRRRAEAEGKSTARVGVPVPTPQIGGVERLVTFRPPNRAQRRRERRGKDGEE